MAAGVRGAGPRHSRGAQGAHLDRSTRIRVLTLCSLRARLQVAAGRQLGAALAPCSGYPSPLGKRLSPSLTPCVRRYPVLKPRGRRSPRRGRGSGSSTESTLLAPPGIAVPKSAVTPPGRAGL